MNTHIVLRKNGKDYNEFGDEVIDCKCCGEPTTMTGTKLCDKCFNAKGFFSKSEKYIIMDGINCFIKNEVNHLYDKQELKKLIKKVKNL